ncbi:hypothetical protein V5799_033216 [Amblyomma americanum]|uniref:Uncharacterized protein n=1 Tax=Amblyomma americanum TaxID=6943 RepID=A0AAQ4DNY5_AMBAM
MKKFARKESSKCLTQTRFKKRIVKTGLPGAHTTQEEFCRRVYPYVLGVHYDKEYGVQDCRVRCQNATDRYTISVVDGTSCDVLKNVREG